MSTHQTTVVAVAIPTQRTPMTSLRKTSLLAGILYLVTFVSIPTLVLYGPVHQPDYIIGKGSDTNIIIGGMLEIIVALAGIGTAIVLYPLLKKQNEGLALGLVAARVLEAGAMFAGVAFLLAVASLRQAGAGATSLVTGHALVTLYDRIFLLGQSFIPALNDVLLGWLLYKSRLVPRALSLMGIVGAFPLVTGYIAILWGAIGQHSALEGLASLPVALFELSLGIYLVVKGFKPALISFIK